MTLPWGSEKIMVVGFLRLLVFPNFCQRIKLSSVYSEMTDILQEVSMSSFGYYLEILDSEAE